MKKIGKGKEPKKCPISALAHEIDKNTKRVKEKKIRKEKKKTQRGLAIPL